MEEKICIKCNKLKNLDNYNLNGRNKDKKANICRECNKERDRVLYTPRYAERRKIRRIKRGSAGQRCNKYKLQKGGECKKCGEKRLHVLNFHHINPKNKKYLISRIIDYNEKIIQKELKKCILLCANCHQDFHHLKRLNNITIKKYLKNIPIV